MKRDDRRTMSPNKCSSQLDAEKLESKVSKLCDMVYIYTLGSSVLH